METAEIQMGQLYYMPVTTLGLPQNISTQYYKVQIITIISSTEVLVMIKHHKTKECNKVVVKVSLEIIKNLGIKYGT